MYVMEIKWQADLLVGFTQLCQIGRYISFASTSQDTYSSMGVIPIRFVHSPSRKSGLASMRPQAFASCGQQDP